MREKQAKGRCKPLCVLRTCFSQLLQLRPKRTKEGRKRRRNDNGTPPCLHGRHVSRPQLTVLTMNLKRLSEGVLQRNARGSEWCLITEVGVGHMKTNDGLARLIGYQVEQFSTSIIRAGIVDMDSCSITQNPTELGSKPGQLALSAHEGRATSMRSPFFISIEQQMLVRSAIPRVCTHNSMDTAVRGAVDEAQPQRCKAVRLSCCFSLVIPELVLRLFMSFYQWQG